MAVERHRNWRAAVAAIAAAMAGALGAAHAAPASAPSIDGAALERVVDQYVQEGMRRDHIVGVGVAVVGPSGPLLLKGYGSAAPGRPADAQTLFHVQSISKTFVWIALMQLIEAGKVAMDDPINAHLPPALKVPDDGYAQPITIRDLMGHRPGFEDSALGHLFVNDPGRLQPLGAYLAQHRPRRVRPPGQVLVYSNYGGALGGALVAQVSGLGWEDYAAQRILAPLGMRSATFRQPYAEAIASARGLPAPMPQTLAARLTDDFRRGANGLQPAPRELTSDVPAGALVASPADMAAYMQALLDPSRMERLGVLKAQTVLAMREPLVRGPAGFGDMRHGFEAIALPGGLDAFGHNGDSTYSGASLTLIPSLGVGIFAAANTGESAPLVEGLPGAIVAALHSPALPQPVYGPGAAAAARALAGDYRDLRRPYFRTEHGLSDLLLDTTHIGALANGDLSMSSALGRPRELVPLGGGVYRNRDGSTRVAFRPLNGRTALFEPYADRALEPIGYFQSPGWDLTIVGVTSVAALAALVSAVLRRMNLGEKPRLARVVGACLGLAAAAWLIGFGLFAATLAKSLTATDVEEIMFWYPPASLVAACWTFAAAAAFSVGALPGLALVARPQGWTVWRRASFALTLAIFLACALTLWGLGLLGFSGW